MKKKKHRGDVSYIVDVDPEDGEILEFMWDEDHDPPPIVKPEKKEGEENGGKN